MAINKEFYNAGRSGGFFDKLILKKRMEMMDIFTESFPADAIEHALDVGVTADSSALSANFFEKLFPDKSKITALSDQDALWLEEEFEGVQFVRASALQMPFEDNSFDVVFSAATLEHVGSRDSQKKMLEECYRVCKKGMFITTPNKWYPVDFHTLLPFVHWLPRTISTRILNALGLSYFSKEENLNLLSQKNLTEFMDQLNIDKFQVRSIKLLAMKSNLLLVVTKS